MNCNYIALVRCRPCPVRTPAFLAALTDGGSCTAPATIFFQGDGCATARALAQEWFGKQEGFGKPDTDRLDLRVCSTSWSRRYGPDPAPAPLRAESLMFLFQRLALAHRVDSFGQGGWYCCDVPDVQASDGTAGRLLMEIGSAPVDERQRRETLEVALGAAALELDAGVLFHGAGLEHLVGEGARGWRQIGDYGLLEILAEGAGGPGGPEIVDTWLSPCRAARRRTKAATILVL